MLAKGENRCMAAWHGGGISHVAMSDVVIGPRFVGRDNDLLRAARGIGTYVGEGF